MPIRLLDRQVIRRNQAQLADSIGKRSADEATLHERYFHVLNAIQPPARNYSRGGDDGPVVECDLTTEANAALLASISRERQISNISPVPEGRRDELTSRYREAVEFLARISPQGYEAFMALVGKLVFAQCSGSAGGSVGRYLGTVWLSPPRAWSVEEFSETLLHETLHQSLFLEELVNGLFSRDVADMSRDDGLVLSAIRRVRRPYYLAFHAAGVSAGIVQEFSGGLLDARAAELRRDLIPTLGELRDKDTFLTPNGSQLLAEFESIAPSDVSYARGRA